MKKILSKIYYKLVTLDKNRKQKKCFNSKFFTVSVGNFHIGGTGKTPVICSILEKFSNAVVVSRGYKRIKKSKKLFFTIKDSVLDVGDEAKLVMGRYDNRFLIGKNRVENVKKYLKNNSCEMFILDDGFQHLQLHRDLDIVLVDLLIYDLKKYYNDNLPLVYAREPASSLERADAVIFTKGDNSELSNLNEKFIRSKFKNKIFFNSTSKLEYPINFRNEHLMASSIIIISGIANNSRFYEKVNEFGIEISNHFYFDDHHQYSDSDIAKIKLFIDRGKIIVTTEKDFVKIKEIIGDYYLSYIFYAKYDIIVDGLNEFILDRSLIYSSKMGI